VNILIRKGNSARYWLGADVRPRQSIRHRAESPR
jgi:hypothetical protein